jgi:hypothetical protein
VRDALKNWLFPGKQKFCADNHSNMEFDAYAAGASAGVGVKYPLALAPAAVFGISAFVEYGIDRTACR